MHRHVCLLDSQFDASPPLLAVQVVILNMSLSSNVCYQVCGGKDDYDAEERSVKVKRQ